jgi:hypothetical protein
VPLCSFVLFCGFFAAKEMLASINENSEQIIRAHETAFEAVK